MNVVETMNLGLERQREGKLAEAEAIYREIIAEHPHVAQAHNNLGILLATRGEHEAAIGYFRQAAVIQPDFGDAVFNWGNVCRAMGRFAEAAKLYQRAAGLRPDFAAAHNNLGNALWLLGRLDEAIEAYQKVLALQPEAAETYNNLGNVYYAKGELDRAWEQYEAAIRRQADFAGAHWNMGLIHLMRGDYEHGWPLFEWRRKVPGVGVNAAVRGPMWDGSELNGRRILIHAEQGFGDMIQFSRYLPLVAERGGRMVVSCQRALHGLLRQMKCVEQWIGPEEAAGEYDVQCPLMSLGSIFKTGLATIPEPVRFAADAALAQQWKERIGPGEGMKVGLVWAGKREPPFRSVPVAALAPLGKIAGVRYISVQTGRAAAEAAPAELKLKNWSAELRDFAETAALIANLDLIITIDTAVAHLSGAMGKPTWVLLKASPDWRWMLGRSDCAWYPSMRLFRQRRAGEWDAPIGEVAGELEKSSRAAAGEN
jgi:Tfp pilus assembly protein PilF